MPGLMEDIWRNRQRSPVTVYSPTRQIRPQGSMANAGTARQVMQQGGGGEGGGFQQDQTTVPRIPVPGTRFSLPGFEVPTGSPGAPLPVPGVAGGDWLDRALATRQAQPEEPRGGFWQNALGTVVNSPIGRAAMLPLNVLDMPRRAVLSSVNEGLDALGINADSRSDGDASWGDWWDQFQDPTFGFGDIVPETGNKWLDRTIGLAGDIAFDPLTYVFGSGLIAGTGARARVGIAARAAASTAVEPAVAVRAGRIGLQALDNAERQALNATREGAEMLLDRGYYFKLPLLPQSTRLRIPLSGRVEQAIGSTFAGARNAIASVRPMATMRYWRSERGLQDAITKVLTGRGEISFGVATALINFRKGAGIARSRAVGLIAAEFGKLQRQYGDAGLNTMVREAETVGNTPLNRLFNAVADMMEREGMVRPDFPNYIPHIPTDGAIRWMKETPEGQAFKNLLFKDIDFDDISPHLLQRKLIKRDVPYIIKGEPFKIEEGSIEEMNRLFRKTFPELDFTFYDDEISSIVARYTKSVSKSIGEAGGLMYLATRARGLVRYADDDAVLKSVVDEAASRKLSLEAHKKISAKLSAAKELRARLERDTKEGVASLTGAMGVHLRKLLSTMDSIDPTVRKELDDMITRMGEMAARRDSMAAAPIEFTRAEHTLDDRMVKVIDELDAQYTKITERLAHIEPAYQAAYARWKAAYEKADSLTKIPPKPPVIDEYRRLIGEATQVRIDVDSAAAISNRIRLARRKAEIIERHLDDGSFLNMAASRGSRGMALGEGVSPLDAQRIAEGMPVLQPGDRIIGTEEFPGALIGEPGRILRRGEAGWERAIISTGEVDVRALNTAEYIYSTFNSKLEAAIEPFVGDFPMLRHYFDQVEVETVNVVRRKARLHDVASTQNRKIIEARLQLLDARQQERDLIAAYNEALKKGIYGQVEAAELKARIEAISASRSYSHEWMNADLPFPDRTPEPSQQSGINPRIGSRIDRAQENLLEAMRPINDARAEYQEALKSLNQAKDRLFQESLKATANSQTGVTLRPRGVDNTAEIAALQREVYDLQAARNTYLTTADGKAEAAAHDRVREIDGELERITTHLNDEWSPAAAARQPFMYGGQGYKPFKVVTGPDGQLHVEDQWLGTLGPDGKKLYDLALKRDDWIIHNVMPLRAERDNMVADMERLLDQRATELNPTVKREITAKLKALQEDLEVLDGRIEGAIRKAGDYDARILGQARAAPEPTELQALVRERRQLQSDILQLRKQAEPTLSQATPEVRRRVADARYRLRAAEDELAYVTANPAKITNYGTRVRELNQRITNLRALTERIVTRERTPSPLLAQKERQLAELQIRIGQVDQAALPEAATAAVAPSTLHVIDEERRHAIISALYDVIERRDDLIIERAKHERTIKRLGDNISTWGEAIRSTRERARALATPPPPEPLSHTTLIQRGTAGWLPEQGLAGKVRQTITQERMAMDGVDHLDNVRFGNKVEWEPVEMPDPEFFGRTGTWTPTERETLYQAYVDKRAIDRIPRRQRTVEDNAERVRAVKTIRHLTDPNRQRAGITFEQKVLKEIGDNFDEDGLTLALKEIHDARVPFDPPTQRSEIGQALAGGSTRGGSRSTIGVANRAIETFEQLNQKFLPEMVERGIIMPGTVALFLGKKIRLEELRRLQKRSWVQNSEIRQLTQDLHRFSEFAYVYRSAMNKGLHPSASASAYIMADRLDREFKQLKREADDYLLRLGSRELNAAEIAREQRKGVLRQKVSREQRNMDSLDDIALERKLTPAEEKKYKNAKARQYRYQRELDTMPAADPAPLLDDEAEFVYGLIFDYLDNISARSSDYYHAREVFRDLGSPVRKAREYQQNITVMQEQLAATREEFERLEAAIMESQRIGDPLTMWQPNWSDEPFVMTPEEVLENIQTGYMPRVDAEGNPLYHKTTGQPRMYFAGTVEISPNARATLEKRAREAIKRRDELGEEQYIDWHRQMAATEPMIVPTEAAVYRHLKMQESITDAELTIERTHASLAAVMGTSELYENHFARLIQDQARPPDIGELRQQFQEFVNALPEDPTQRQQLQLQLMQDRIDTVRAGQATPEELQTWERLQRGHKAAREQYQINMVGEEAFRASQAATDDGYQLFTDIVTGVRPIDDADVEIMTNLYESSAEAEFSAGWLRTFRQLVDVAKRRRARHRTGTAGGEPGGQLLSPVAMAEADKFDRAEALWIIDEMRRRHGDNQLNDEMERVLAEQINDTTNFGDVEANLAAAYGREQRIMEQGLADEEFGYTPAGNLVAVPRAGAQQVSFGAIERSVVNTLVATAMQRKDEAISETMRLFRLLGMNRRLPFDVSPSTASFGASKGARKFRVLGYNLRGGSLTDKQKLITFINEFLHGMDYDWSHAIRRRLRENVAHQERLMGMRAALGEIVDESLITRVPDPEGLLQRLARQPDVPADQIEDGAEVIQRVLDYDNYVVPQEMEQIYADRFSQLQTDLTRAITKDDLPAIAAIHNQLNELRAAQRPPPIHEAAAQVPAPGEDELVAAAAEHVPMGGAEEAARTDALAAAAQGDLDRAQAELAEFQTMAAQQQPAAEAPTQARTLSDLVSDPEFQRAPGNSLTHAEILIARRSIMSQIAGLLPPGATVTGDMALAKDQLLSQMADLAGRAWKKRGRGGGEPQWQINVADRINDLETKGTPLPWDTGVAVDNERLRVLTENVQTAQRNLEQAQRDAANAPVGQGTPSPSMAQVDGPPTDVAERRAHLQAEADAARARGDENAARFAEQQMGWLDDPESAARHEVVDPVESSGVGAVPTEIDPIGPPPHLTEPGPDGMPELIAQRQKLDDDFDDIVDEFRLLMQNYGPYADMPEGVKQRLAALSASARRLADERNKSRAAASSSNQQALRDLPETQRYLARVEQAKPLIEPSIAADWENIMRYGAPSRVSYDYAIEQRLTPRFKPGGGNEEESVRLTGELFGGAPPGRGRLQQQRLTTELPRKEAALVPQLEAARAARLSPVRERMMAMLTRSQADILEAQQEGVAMTLDAMTRNVAGQANAEARWADMLAAPERQVAEAVAEREAASTELTRLSNERQGLNVQGNVNRASREGQMRQAHADAAKRAAAEDQARRVGAQKARTDQLRDLDMDIATLRDDILTAKDTVNELSTMRVRINRVLGDIPSDDAAALRPYMDDLRDLAATVRGLEGVDPDDISVIETLLTDAMKAERELSTARGVEGVLSAIIKGFGKDPGKAKMAGDVMKSVTIDGWSPIATKLLRYDDEMAAILGTKATATAEETAAAAAKGLRGNTGVVIAQELRARLDHVSRMMETPEPWKLIDKYTAFFKTYATARPGFHVRNALSAVFMNLVDFVSIRSQWDAMSIWRGFMRDPLNYYNSANAETRRAIDAVFASGAGGQFMERGVGTVEGPAGRVYRRLMNNKLTNWNKRLGTAVEGTARLGMALDSVRRGHSLEAAIDRVTKYHFNYTELAPMDVQARRYIPFWTFMSRNLPLQLEQMWLRPQMYLRYQSVMRNFGETPDPLTPEYWLQAGAFTLDENAAERESPWYLAPDLPHTRVFEPFQAMQEGEWGKALLSDVNPLFMAPLEAFGINKKVYTGAPLDESYREPSAAMMPLMPLMMLLGGVERGGRSGNPMLDQRYAHIARSLLPPVDIVERLTDEGGVRAGRQDETVMRQFLGLPVLQLTPELRRQTRRTNRAQRAEQRDIQADLARL